MQDSLKYCARQLFEMKYTRFGIGSMAHLYNTEEIVKRVKAVQVSCRFLSSRIWGECYRDHETPRGTRSNFSGLCPTY